jgi:mannose-1-phosphate guanylyltransferase
MATTNHYIVILCGGTGPRLWPLSRTDNPKQFLTVIGNSSLLNQTISRCQKIVPLKNIFLVTNQKYLSKIKHHISPKFLSQNILGEPEKKNTAMAIIYAATFIQKIDPQAIVSVLPSDHFVKKSVEFKKTLNTAVSLAKKHQKIVLLGSSPTFANPSYGYIHPGPDSSVLGFVEKPNPPLIEKLIKNGYLWNLGIYTFSPSTLFSQLAKHQPLYFSLHQKLLSSPLTQNTLKKIYHLSPSLAIDHALSEKSKELLVLPITFVWSDVGEWKTIYRQLTPDSDGFAKINNQTNFVQFDSKNCLLFGSPKKLIGLVGVENLAIIDTPDALLVCQIQKSFHVRDLITKIVNSEKLKHFFVAKNDH